MSRLPRTAHVLPACCRLYFKSDDPYLTAHECHLIVMAFGPRSRRKLLKTFEREMVDEVLGVRGARRVV